jgi:hypothetical protein
LREAKIDKNGFLAEFQAFYTMMPLVLLLTVVLSDNSSKICSALKKASIIPIMLLFCSLVLSCIDVDKKLLIYCLVTHLQIKLKQEIQKGIDIK